MVQNLVIKTYLRDLLVFQRICRFIFYILIFQDSKVIELNPKNENVYFNRVVAKDKLKDFQGAIDDYSKVIEINPKNEDTYFNRGNARVELIVWKFSNVI